MPRSERARFMDLVKFNGVVEGSRRSIVGPRAQHLLCVIQKVLEAAEHEEDKKSSLLRSLTSGQYCASELEGEDGTPQHRYWNGSKKQ